MKIRFFLLLCISLIAQGFSLSVEMKDEQSSNPSILALRTRIVNDSTSAIFDVKLRYVFTKKAKNIVLDTGYTAGAHVSLQMVNDTLGYIEIQVDSIPQGFFPNSSGLYQGLHYYDWSSIEKQEHPSYVNNIDFATNTNILLYIKDSLVLGKTSVLPNPALNLKIVGFQPENNAWIDVKNFGDEGVYLGGVSLMGRDGIERTLNSIYLEPAEVMRICRNDQACGEIEKTVLMPDFPWGRIGEALLKKDSTYLSYVPWGGKGNFVREAVVKNVWKGEDDFFPPSMLKAFSSVKYTNNMFYRVIGKAKGTKTDNWFSFSDRDNPSVIQTAPVPVKITMDKPVNYRLTERDEVTLKWLPVKRAKQYKIVLRNLEKMETQEMTTSNTSVTVALADGTYSWIVYCEEYIDENGFVIHIEENGNALDLPNTQLISKNVNIDVWNALPIDTIIGHKDTRFLFLGYGQKALEYNWDRSHENMPHLSNSYRCWLVASQLMNHIYGGNITQDEILYAVRFNSNEPLVDPFFPVGADTTESMQALRFSLGSENIERHKGSPSYDVVKHEIDSGNPIYVAIDYASQDEGHAMVIYGYVGEKDNYAFLYAFDDNYGNLTNSVAKPDLIREYYLVRTSYASVAFHDSRLDMDSDADGITDFDEIERFGTDPYNSDTDEDGIDDKKEIYRYTIKAKYDETKKFTFPDIARDVQKKMEYTSNLDGDSLRAERDNDDNNNGIRDGLEGFPFRYIDSSYAIISDMNVPRDYTLFARDHLTINDGVECYNSILLNEGYCKIGAAGQNIFSYDNSATVLSLGARSHVGFVDVRPIDYVDGNIFLRSSARIHGDLNLYTELNIFNCAKDSIPANYNIFLVHQDQMQVDGSVNTRCARHGENETRWRGNYQCNLPDISIISFEENLTVRRGEIYYLQDGDAYKTLKVESGATLVVTPGEFYVDSLLQLESNAKIEFLSPGEASILHLNGKIIWRPVSDFALTDTAYWSNVAKGFKLVQHSSKFMFIEGSFGGTVYAPLSKLILGQVHKYIYGRFFAKDIEVHQYAKVFRVDFEPIIKPSYAMRR